MKPEFKSRMVSGTHGRWAMMSLNQVMIQLGKHYVVQGKGWAFEALYLTVGDSNSLIAADGRIVS